MLNQGSSGNTLGPSIEIVGSLIARIIPLVFSINRMGPVGGFYYSPMSHKRDQFSFLQAEAGKTEFIRGLSAHDHIAGDKLIISSDLHHQGTMCIDPGIAR